MKAIDLVSKEFDTNAHLFIGGNDIDDISLNPECPASERNIITRVLDIDQQSEELVSVDFLSDAKRDRAIQVRLRSP